MRKQKLLQHLISIWKNADITDEEREALEIVIKELEE